ncbi:hypothetical protein MKW94_002999, partial [Papaver nudicaule]|nr:hypothetical protein [Papaver nudicaule]
MAEQEMEVEDYSLKREKKKKRKRKSIDVKIEMVKENPEKIAPLVGYFPTGYDPHKNDNGDDVKVYRRGARLELVVKPKKSKVSFVGTNYSGEAATPITCQYALGVLDKETQTLKIVKIESNKIFRLEPNFAGKDEPLTTEDTYAKMRDLIDAFGTKKAKRKNEVRDRLNRKEDADIEKSTHKKVTELKVNPVATASDGSLARNIPHYDILAETPEKAYPLDRMISKQEMDILKNDLEGKLLNEERPSP